MSTDWSRYSTHLLRYEDLGISLDTSCMHHDEGFLARMEPRIARALADMAALEAGAIANPDEGRMVGHYWLRDSSPRPGRPASRNRPRSR